MRPRSRSLLAWMAALWSACAFAQCGSTISAFPYSEGFEASAAWTSGGTGDDWAWGVPNHPLINSAGGGAKVWCVGGLSGAFYTYSEQSWLEGPCFDFGALQYPYVSFKIFWECEREWDGLGFQYSLDQGATWHNVGAANEASNCTDQNWFNTPYISNMSLATPKQGWSGRVGATSGSCTGGLGSGGWVTASHCMVDLAGEPSVKFRFVFGAGSTCNNYDGIAIDDVYIGEAPPENPQIETACLVDVFTVSGVTSCADVYSWDFDDPASGADNTSSLATPQHVFSGPGIYNVVLTLTYACRPPELVPFQVNVLDLTMDGTDPGCNGNDGSVAAVVVGAQGPITYQWEPGGQGTQTITGLGAGDYTVNVSSAGACPTSGTATLSAPQQAPQFDITAQDVSCFGASDGSAFITVTSALPGYSIAWSPQGGSAATTSGLGAGDYSCTVTDVQGCTTTHDFEIGGPDELVISAQSDTAICLGESLVLQASVNGGTPPYDLIWSPVGPDVSPASTTTYTASATDGHGCAAIPREVTVSVGSVATPSFIVDDSLGCSPHCVTFEANAPADVSVDWDFGDGTTGSGVLAQHCFSLAGTYGVTIIVTSPDGCDGAWMMSEAVDVLSSPTAAFTVSPVVATIEDPTAQFIDLSSGADSWLWTFDAPLDTITDERSPSVRFPAVGCHGFELRVQNSLGCADSIAGSFCVEDEFAAYIPNSFTPNGDGFNEDWGAVTTVGDPVVFELFVFDRWGQVIFEASEPRQRWEGGSVPEGVYPWRLRMIDTKGIQQVRIGHVTLLR